MKPDFLKIDQLRLDQEWLHQPRLYFEMAQELADAQLEQNRADSDLKLVAAELDLAIRENPAKFKLLSSPVGCCWPRFLVSARLAAMTWTAGVITGDSLMPRRDGCSAASSVWGM